MWRKLLCLYLLQSWTISRYFVKGSQVNQNQKSFSESNGTCLPIRNEEPQLPPPDTQEDDEYKDYNDRDIDYDYNRLRKATTQKILPHSNEALCSGVYLVQTNPILKCFECRRLIYRDSNISIIQTNLLQDLGPLEELEMANIGIQKIEPGAFANLPFLTELNFEMNGLKKIVRGTFNSLRRLRSLKLSHNVISEIEDESFHGSICIEILDLSYNKISVLPQGLFLHLNLISLDISNNLLAEIGDVLCHSVPKLTKLMLNNNHLSSIPNCLNHSIISELSLSFNSISEFNSTLLPLGLTSFAISNNDLQQIDEDAFRSMTHLKSIDISVNSLDSLHPKYFEDLQDLTSLKLTGNNIKILNSKLFMFTKSLTELQIGNNNITFLPKRTFQHLLSLKRLDLSENNIEFIQLDVLKDLVSLEFLNISHNKIEYLQSGVFNGLRMLAYLDLSYNNIESIPSHVLEPLSNLTVLDIKFNQIRTMDIQQLLYFCWKINLLHIDGNNFSCIELGKIFSYIKYHKVILEGGNTFSSENINGISCHEYVLSQMEPNTKDRMANITSFFMNDFKNTSFYNFFKNFDRKTIDFTEQNLTSALKVLYQNSTTFSNDLNLHVKEFIKFENTSFQNVLNELIIIAQRLNDVGELNRNLSFDDLSSSLRNEIKTFVTFENTSFLNYMDKLSEIVDKMVENQNESKEIPEIMDKLHILSAQSLFGDAKGNAELISAINQFQFFLISCIFIVFLLVTVFKIFPRFVRRYCLDNSGEHNLEMPILS